MNIFVCYESDKIEEVRYSIFTKFFIEVKDADAYLSLISPQFPDKNFAYVELKIVDLIAGIPQIEGIAKLKKEMNDPLSAMSQFLKMPMIKSYVH